MVIINKNDLIEVRKEHSDKKVVFCSGNFDLTHVGHVLFFEDCKKQGDLLVVGVGGDYILRINKGLKRPIFNEKTRVKMVDSLKPVDYCFIDDISTKEDPLRILNIVFEKLKPDFYVINEDAFNIPHRQELAEKYNVKLVILKRWCPKEFEEGMSTTDIIEKVRSL